MKLDAGNQRGLPRKQEVLPIYIPSADTTTLTPIECGCYRNDFGYWLNGNSRQVISTIARPFEKLAPKSREVFSECGRDSVQQNRDAHGGTGRGVTDHYFATASILAAARVRDKWTISKSRP